MLPPLRLQGQHRQVGPVGAPVKGHVGRAGGDEVAMRAVSADILKVEWRLSKIQSVSPFADLGCVYLDLRCFTILPVCSANSAKMPYAKAELGRQHNYLKSKVNTTKVRNLMESGLGAPVSKIHTNYTEKTSYWETPVNSLVQFSTSYSNSAYCLPSRGCAARTWARWAPRSCTWTP